MNARKTILETKRFLLREFHVDDAQDIFELNEDPEVIRYTGNVRFVSVEEARQLIETYDQYDRFGMGRWSVFSKLTGDFVGWSGLKYTLDSGEVDLGFRFFRRYWNLGYATETARACIVHGFEKLNLSKIVARARVENAASHRVLRKIGMDYVRDFDAEGRRWSLYEIRRSMDA